MKLIPVKVFKEELQCVYDEDTKVNLIVNERLGHSIYTVF